MTIKQNEFIPDMYPYQNTENDRVVTARMINAPFALETDSGIQYGSSGDYVVETDGVYAVMCKEVFEPTHKFVHYGE